MSGARVRTGKTAIGIAIGRADLALSLTPRLPGEIKVAQDAS